MDIDKVQKIFTDSLAKCVDLANVCVESCKEVSENAFAETACNQDISPEKRYMILKLIDGQARLSYFWELQTEYIAIADTELFKHMIFLLNVYEDAVRYCYDNYYLLSEDTQNKNEKEPLKRLADSISSRTQERTTTMFRSGVTFFPHKELDHMADAFALTARLILGDEVFAKFREVNNRSLGQLRRLYRESVTSRTNSVN